MFVVRYFVSILVCNDLDGEVRASCFTKFAWCLVIVVWLFLPVPRICLQFVIVVFPDHTHYFWSITVARRLLAGRQPKVCQVLLRTATLS